MGTSKSIDSSAAFLFEVPGSNSPLVVQELQIGGTSTADLKSPHHKLLVHPGDFGSTSGTGVNELASAANLKFLPGLPHVRYRNFKFKSRTRNSFFAGAALIPKFASEVVPMACELRNRSFSAHDFPKFAKRYC
jgi:hypothetical protein